ncbi:MAG TPA: DUF5011 domain-containing protein, partial [Candidatus Hydrogenedentes bacterium]|nr:DUF5011 domain-containing protein [Candidatus Hydrogenedentota bacterium]
VYNVADSSGNSDDPITRTVRVVDRLAPTLFLGTWDDSVEFEEDGFLVVEAGHPFASLEPPDFAASDACAGELGLPKSELEENEPGVVAWAWALNAQTGEPNDDGTVLPVTYTYDEFTYKVGDHLLIYQAKDGVGRTYPDFGGDNVPDVFDDDFRLDVLDEEGNFKVDYVRLVRVVDTIAPTIIELVGGARIVVDCAVKFVDPGYRVTDIADGNVEVSVSGDPDVFTPGNYVRTYFARDSVGNEQTVERLITVRDNCPTTFYELDIVVEGEGAVEVFPAQLTYAEGTEVSLTAAPGFKFRFARWDGALSGTSSAATLVMDSDKTVTAIFTPVVWLTMIVTPPDAGKLTMQPEPIELVEGAEVGAWVGIYDPGRTVAISVETARRFRFKGWRGDVEEPEKTGCRVGCRRDIETIVAVTMDTDKTIEAVFKRKLPWWVYVLIIAGVGGAIAAIAGG